MSNFQKNSKGYGEPDITYQLAGSAEQRPLGIPMALRIGQAKCWSISLIPKKPSLSAMTAKPPCQPLTVVILSGFSKWKYEVSSLMIFKREKAVSP